MPVLPTTATKNVMDNANLDQESWDNFKISTNSKMNELEKPIKALADKVS